MPEVLIADDEEFVRHFLRTILESSGFNVAEEVESGDVLYEMITETRPDILLLDINMPNLKGNEFLKRYGKMFQNLCIIVLTISASAKVKEELEKCGCKYFIRKDTPPDELIKQIKLAWRDFLSGKNSYA